MRGFISDQKNIYLDVYFVFDALYLNFNGIIQVQGTHQISNCDICSSLFQPISLSEKLEVIMIHAYLTGSPVTFFLTEKM